MLQGTRRHAHGAFAADCFECVQELESSCGTEAPTLPDSCVGEVLEECEAFVGHSDALAVACGEEPPAVNLAQVGECCDSFDEPLPAP